MRSNSPIFAQSANTARSHTTLQNDAELFCRAASWVVTRCHVISDRHVNVRSTGESTGGRPEGLAVVVRGGLGTSRQSTRFSGACDFSRPGRMHSPFAGRGACRLASRDSGMISRAEMIGRAVEAPAIEFAEKCSRRRPKRRPLLRFVPRSNGAVDQVYPGPPPEGPESTRPRSRRRGSTR